MRRKLLTAFCATALLSAQPAAASYSVGAALHGLIVDSEPDFGHSSGQGPELFGWWAHNDHLALRGGAYYLTSPLDAGQTIVGARLAAVAGLGLQRPGWRLFGGLGYYREQWSWSASLRPGETHAGWLLTVGGGYDWQRLSLELSLDYRDTSSFTDAYREFYRSDYVSSGVSLSGGLGLSYRF